MPSIQTRVYWRLTRAQEEAISTAIAAVQADVNAFLITLPNLGDALDVRYEIQPVSKYGSMLMYMATITYVDT